MYYPVSKGEITHFSPIDLQKFTGHAFKTKSQVSWCLLACTAHFAHVVVAGGFSCGVGMIRVGTSSFQHTDQRDILIEPLSNLSVKDRHGTGPLAGFRFLLHLLA